MLPGGSVVGGPAAGADTPMAGADARVRRPRRLVVGSLLLVLLSELFLLSTLGLGLFASTLVRTWP